MEPRIQYCKTEDGVSLAHMTLGEGEPLLFLWNPHSNIEQQWDIPEFRTWYKKLAQGRMLILPDYRGTGRSQRDVSDISMDALERDITAIAGHLGLEKFSLFATFTMGPVAIRYAAHYPERVNKLVCWHAYVSGRDYRSPQGEALGRMSDDWDLYTDTLARFGLGFSGGEAAKRFGATIRDGITHDTYLAYDAELTKADVADLLLDVKAPTLVLKRRDVTLIHQDTPTLLASNIPDARLVLLEGESGGYALGDSDAVLDAIDEFLGDGEDAKAADQQAEPPAPAAPPAAVRRKGATPTEPRVHYAKTEDGVSIAYWTLGEGVPIVWSPMVPGTPTDLLLGSPATRRWVDALAERGKLILYDGRGSPGLSGGNLSDFSISTAALDLDAVVEHLGLESFILWGSVYVGPAVIAYAATHPDKVSKLALWCTWARLSDAIPPSQLKALTDLMEADTELFADTAMRLIVGYSAGEEVRDLSVELTKGLDSVTPEEIKAAMAAILEMDVTALLPQVRAPTLVLHRRQVPMVNAKVATDLASGIRNAALALLEGDSSSPNVGDMEAVLAAFDEFLGIGDREGDSAGVPAQDGDAFQTRISPAPEAKTFASGRYVVVRLLGQGAQKSVYLVDDTVLGRQCALSMLNAALLDPGDVDRLKREAQTMAQFGTQPNIVTVHDYGEEDGAPFIVCEYVPGGELRDEVNAAAGPLPLERALAVATDVCRALSFAHGRDVVHRDLKPENIWLTEERSAKLGDFGIALSLGRTRLTIPGGATGTALYMAPEQVSGGDVDARSDLYAFGVLLYELVAGRPPFIGDDPNAIMYQHVNAEPESPAQHNASVPPGLEGLIMRLLAKAQADRPGSAEEVLSELEKAATELATGQPAAAATVRGERPRLMEPEVRFCTSADGTQLAYATYGEDSGTPLVQVNSWMASHESSWEAGAFRHFLEDLAQGRRVISIDRRGVGASQRDVDDVSLEAQVADVAAVVDHLGLEQFDLVGWFDGAPLSVAYAAQHPQRIGRLVLSGVYPRGQDAWRPEVAHSLLELIRTNWSLARRMIADISNPDAPAEHRLERANALRHTVSPESAAKYVEFMTSFDVTSLIPRVQAPTLIFHSGRGGGRVINASRAVAAQIPGARFAILDGPGPLADRGETAELIRTFLDEADAGAEAVKSQPTTGGAANVRLSDMDSPTASAQTPGDAKEQGIHNAYAQIVHAALQAHEGTEMGHSGDDVRASFPSVQPALDCAIAIQRRYRDEHPDAPLAVYIRLNAGEPVTEDGPNGLPRTPVDLEAGLVDHLQPGQIVASDVVRQLAAGKDFLFADLGETSLPGFEDAGQLWELKWE